MPIALKPFDPSRDFIAATNFRAAGAIWTRKRPFDKSVVNARVLRQLYESRKITYPRGDAEPALVPDPLVDEDDPIENHETDVQEDAQEETGASDESSDPEGEAVTRAASVQGEAAAAPDGDAETVAADPANEQADRDAKIDQLMIDNSQAKLLEMAQGLEGVNSKTPKKALAALLVDAGRAG